MDNQDIFQKKYVSKTLSQAMEISAVGLADI